MKILVTGVAGAIGSHLAERLLGLGHEVVGIDALTDYYSPEIKKINAKDVEEKGGKIFFKNLVNDPIDNIVRGVDVIFNMAAQPGISATTPFEDYLNNNIVATERLLQSSKKSSKLKMFFQASTSSVYGVRADGDETTEPKPTSYYGVTKLAAEQLAMSYYRDLEIPVSVLRFFSVYGERERPEKFYHRLIKSILENKEVSFFTGSEYHVRSYTYVGDIVDGCILALNNLEKVNGEIFNMGSDKTATTGEGMQIVEKIMGQKAKLKILPRRRGDQFETSAHIGKIKALLGYSPRVSLEEGLAAEIKWYKGKIFNKIKQ
ncbi:MAG: NAD-dependent epimerase/dehydratase family protein [Patescibacteria group bacterium]|nr:NAD-dependent epimerase/dehydratase family protein [bacterium]MDZ4240507.1 NAD-dependent epimerase/dehydratase family protein [Patescibacteria group bacterium]